MSVLRAGVVGTRWGRVHVHALRCAGVEVAALCGRNPDRTRAVAAAEGIERAVVDPRELRDLDVIALATPVGSRARLLRMFAGQHVICEKPLLGVTGRAADLPPLPSAFVNYAFGFLDTARLAQARVPQLGDLRSVTLHTQIELPAAFSPAEWLMEAASHPLSWLLTLLGPARAVAREGRADALSLTLHCRRGVDIGVHLRTGGAPGIHHRLRLIGSAATLAFHGGFTPGDTWRFSPLTLDGEPVSDGEYGDSDCWVRANVRAVAAMIDIFAGSGGGAAVPGGPLDPLFDLSRAAALELPLQPVGAAPAGIAGPISSGSGVSEAGDG